MRYILIFLNFLYAWQLIGGYDGKMSEIKPFIAWKMIDNNWAGYSDKDYLMDLIKKRGYKTFDYAREYEGVWVYDNVEFTPKKRLFYQFKSGWNLVGGISTFELDKFLKIWKYDNGWMGYIKDQRSDFNSINSNEGLWVFFKDDTNLSFNYTKFMPFYPVGSKDINLDGDFAYSFIISENNTTCNPRWDWDIDANLYEYQYLVKSGMISFGGAGAEGKSLAYVCDEDSLYEAYKNVINTYSIKWLDFDIEGGMLSESDANNKRFKVLAKLKEEIPELKISLTLPIMPEGFDDDVKNLIKLAKDYNLDIYSYNLMLMDFSPSYPADDENKTLMYHYSVSAIESANAYLLKTLDDPKLDDNYYYKLGAIAMIGQNDITNEIFYRNDFALLRDYVLKKGLRVLSFWGIHRDNATDTNLSSRYGRDEYEFYNIGKFVLLNTISYLNKDDDFYWQLTGDIKEVDAKIYDIDMFENSKEVINNLKQKGKIVICYINAGAWEAWRDDSDEFDDEVIGNELDGWEDEKWLDIRSENVREIMKKRIALAASKGCDGIEFDNIDGYLNNTGFSLTYDDQLEYNKFLATEAKKYGMLVAQKNDFDQIDELVNYYDFLIAEEAIEFNEYDKFLPYIIQNKPIYDIEYNEEYFDCDKDFKVYLMNKDLDGSLYEKCKE